jgi:hypothetical protein
MTDHAQADEATMSSSKKTDTSAAAPTTPTEGSAPTSTPAGSSASNWLATEAKITKDPSAGNIVKKANGQKLVTGPSGFNFIFEEEMLFNA